MTSWFYVGPNTDKPRDAYRDPEDARSFPVVVCEERLAVKYVEFWMADSRVPEPKMVAARGVRLDPGGPWHTKWEVYEFDLDGLRVSVAAQHVYEWTYNVPAIHDECFPGNEPFVVFEGRWQQLCLYKPHAERLLAWLAEIEPEAERVAETEPWGARGGV